jgi:hypothetical protein
MKHTDETKQKLSDMRKGEKNPFFGQKHTQETKQKLAKVLREHNANRTYKITQSTIVVPDEIKMSYLAGIVDGEGTVGFRRKRPFVAIYNSNQELMEWLISNVGGTYSGTDKRGRVLGYTWSVQSARNVYVLCSALLPLLIIKREKANEVIKHLEEKYGERITDSMVLG